MGVNVEVRGLQEILHFHVNFNMQTQVIRLPSKQPHWTVSWLWWDTSVVPTLRGWKSISIEFHISLRKQDLVFKIKLKTKTYPRCSGCTPVIPIPGNQEDQSSGHHPPLQGKFQANPGDPGWKQSFFFFEAKYRDMSFNWRLSWAAT